MSTVTFFKARTTNAYSFKILAELLSNNLKIGHFTIDDAGIGLQMMDSHRRVLISLFLQAENFTHFKISRKLYIGINLQYLHRMLRSVKKKDTLELSISDDNAMKLAIKVYPKDNNRVTTSHVTIQNVQEIEIEMPPIETKPIIIPAAEFQKMLKEMSAIGNTISISASRTRISFKCETSGIIERTVEFGDDLGGPESEAEVVDVPRYNESFLIEQLTRITKLAGLSNVIKVYPGNPLMFKSCIDNMGEISIYIKNRDQIELDNHIEVE